MAASRIPPSEQSRTARRIEVRVPRKTAQSLGPEGLSTRMSLRCAPRLEARSAPPRDKASGLVLGRHNGLVSGRHRHTAQIRFIWRKRAPDGDKHVLRRRLSPTKREGPPTPKAAGAKKSGEGIKTRSAEPIPVSKPGKRRSSQRGKRRRRLDL